MPFVLDCAPVIDSYTADIGYGGVLGENAVWDQLDRDLSELPPPGLWAVEPHIGRGGVGTKFEELLVITGDSAFWLDDDVPHVNRWSSR